MIFSSTYLFIEKYRVANDTSIRNHGTQQIKWSPPSGTFLKFKVDRANKPQNKIRVGAIIETNVGEGTSFLQ